MSNGLKNWLIGVATAVTLAWAGWASTAIVEVVPRTEVEQRLQRIEDKIDRLIERRWQHE